ncbi:MAG: hypothetical protein GX876_12920, partial [Bacteroidales bacterium]|nr:hypothetical protein [Bacteroidales bacterium]
MARKIIRIVSFMKGAILLIKPHILFGWLKRPFLKISNTLSLSEWVSEQKGNFIINDFYSVKRDYSKRYKLYKAVSGEFNLENEAVVYIEFGVSGGCSFKWWLNECT